MPSKDVFKDLFPQIAVFGYTIGWAVGCAVSALRKTSALRKAVHWPSVPGTIIESFYLGGRGNAYSIRYVFVAGHEITGKTPRLCGNWFWRAKQVKALVARYQVGEEVEVFYDPTNPKRNCIDREDRRGIELLWVGAAVWTLFTALLAWLV
jgi:hypothetical protein